VSTEDVTTTERRVEQEVPQARSCRLISLIGSWNREKWPAEDEVEEADCVETPRSSDLGPGDGEDVPTSMSLDARSRRRVAHGQDGGRDDTA
jgi:hypothetical protein